jgi:hypothetical protein
MHSAMQKALENFQFSKAFLIFLYCTSVTPYWRTAQVLRTAAFALEW